MEVKRYPRPVEIKWRSSLIPKQGVFIKDRIIQKASEGRINEETKIDRG